MTTGIIFGAWDLLHAGHVIALESCKRNCDYLIVGLHSDPSIQRKSKNKPVQSLFERFTQLQACKFVDEIVPYETEEDILNILNAADIQIRFLGEDYLDRKDITGGDIVQIMFIPRSHNYSTSELRKRCR